MRTAIFNWFSLIDGIQFLLGLQLIIVGVIHFVYSARKSRIPLAWLCVIHGLWFFKRVFYGYWEDNFLLFVLIGPGKPIFVGALLFFYFRLYSGLLTRNYVLRQLTLPTVYYASILFFRFYYLHTSPPLDRMLSFVFSTSTLLIFGYFFWLTRRELRERTQQHLIPKAYRKLLWLFYSVYFFLLQVPLWDMLKLVFQYELLPESRHALLFSWYQNFLIYIGEYSVYIYLHLLGYFLFLYVVSELPFFKRTFLPKDVMISPKVRDRKEELERRIHHQMITQHRYKDPDLSLDAFARILDVPKKELTDHLLLNGRPGFKQWVNQLRVKEFKRLAVHRDYAHYDLVGLALECGFRSKSTFFRVFKSLEGMTPNQFKQEA